MRIRRASLFFRIPAAAPDVTAPTVLTAIVQNATPAQVDLVFSEAMSATWSASLAWTVSGHAVTGVTRTGPTTGYLSLSSAFVNGEAARTLAYTQPGTNNMQDLAGNLLANFSGKAITNNVAAGGALTPAMAVENVDASGVRQTTTVVSGITSISGVAPFLVKFDASGTRSTQSDANTDVGAFHNIGYRIDFGEALGTTWTYPTGFNYSKDEDTGPPIFFRAFTTTGTKTVRLRCKDSAGNEVTISMSVVVAASSTLTTVNIPVASGSWGTLVSSRRYTLDAGGNYSGFGHPPTGGLHNIIFEKTGGGADPIMSLRPESRNVIPGGGARAANIRTLNIDVTNFEFRTAGFDYCGCVFGHVRQITSLGSSYQFVFEHDVSNATDSNTIRYSRGFFMWDTGETDNNGDYVLIDETDSGAFYGVKFVNAGGGFEHNVRTGYRDLAWRYCNLYNTTSQKTIIKYGALGYAAPGGTEQPDAYRDDNRVALFGGAMYGYASYRHFFHRMQFGGPGEFIPETVIGIAPQNNDSDGQKEGIDLSGVEDCVTYAADPESFSDVVSCGGRNLFVRNFKKSMGAGADMTVGDQNLVKVPSGWNTGRLYETTNTRPVPSTF